MRLTTVLKKLIGVERLVAVAFAFADIGLIIDVKPSWRKPRTSS